MKTSDPQLVLFNAVTLRADISVSSAGGPELTQADSAHFWVSPNRLGLRPQSSLSTEVRANPHMTSKPARPALGSRGAGLTPAGGEHSQGVAMEIQFPTRSKSHSKAKNGRVRSELEHELGEKIAFRRIRQLI